MAASFRGLRVWQSAHRFKLAIYRLSDEGPFGHERRLREQLRESAASAPSQIAEGYGRFDPPDNARFVRIAKASLMEQTLTPNTHHAEARNREP